MLVSFSIKNYLSFKEKTTINFISKSSDTSCPQNIMQAEAYQKERKKAVSVLKSMGFYGANASGKTNVLKAILDFRQSVLQLDRLKKVNPDDMGQPSSDKANPPSGNLLSSPFLLDAKTRNAPSELEITLLLGSVVYRYGFAILNGAVKEEWLFAADTNPKEHLVFSRKEYKSKPPAYSYGQDYKKKLVAIVEDMELVGSGTLLLPVAESLNFKPAQAILAFARGITVLDANESFFFGEASDIPEQFLPALTSLMHFADFGIDKVESVWDMNLEKLLTQQGMASIERRANSRVNDVLQTKGKLTPEEQEELKIKFVSSESEYLTESMNRIFGKKKIMQFHFKDAQGEPVVMPNGSQSRGTLTFFTICAQLLRHMGKSTVLLCDEIESSLHRDLCAAFFEIFYAMAGLKAQLIFTTHDTSLLDRKGLFRRDQIIITEKAPSGETMLAPLDAYTGIRNTSKLGDYYRDGLLGGLPVFDMRAKQAFIESVALISGKVEGKHA